MYIPSNLHELVITVYLYDIFHVITKLLHADVSLVNYGDSRKLISPMPLQQGREGATGWSQSVRGRLQKEICALKDTTSLQDHPTLRNLRGPKDRREDKGCIFTYRAHEDWNWLGPSSTAAGVERPWRGWGRSGRCLSRSHHLVLAQHSVGT